MGNTRRAARVLLVDDEACVLLLFGRDSHLADDPGWWLTPGGGVDGDEELTQTAIREVFEETGRRLDHVEGPIGERDTTFTFEDEEIHQHETFYWARVSRFAISPAGWTEVEKRSLTEHRWWSATELAATSDVVYPENLIELLAKIA